MREVEVEEGCCGGVKVKVARTIPVAIGFKLAVTAFAAGRPYLGSTCTLPSQNFRSCECYSQLNSAVLRL